VVKRYFTIRRKNDATVFSFWGATIETEWDMCLYDYLGGGVFPFHLDDLASWSGRRRLARDTNMEVWAAAAMMGYVV